MRYDNFEFHEDESDLSELNGIAHRLARAGYIQVGADLHYLIAWLKSTEWTADGTHLAPHPLGQNTIDKNSNNCPIPLYKSIIPASSGQHDNLNTIKQLLINLKTKYTLDDELSSLNCFISYTNALLGIDDSEGDEDPDDSYLDVLLYLRGEQDIPQSKSFAANDFWWPCIQSQQSRTDLQSFGVSVTSMDTAFDTGNGMILFDNANFNYELLGLYTDNGQTQATADLSNFFASNHSNQGDLCVTIDSINAFSTPCLSWKLRIRKTEESGEEDEYTEEIWYLRNNDERNYDIRRDNASPALYKDGSLKTEFGKTYEVLELRKVNGDLVDAEQDGIEKPVNAVCPAVLSGDVANNQATMYYQWYGNSSYISVYTVKVRVLNYLTLYTTRYDNGVRNYGDVTVANGTTLAIRQRGEKDSGRIPEMYKKGYIYNIIKVLKDDGTEIDKTGISVINDGGYFAVKNNSGSDISFNHLQVKLEVDPDPTFTAYSRSGSYQKSNNTLSETAWTTLYESGSNSAVTGDITKDYEIIGMWNASGVSVYKDGIGLSCYLYSGNPRIRIFNKYGNGTITWNYIEYKAYDKFRLYMLPSHDDMELGISSGAPARFSRNGVPNAKRTPNEIYTITGAYKADGTPVEYSGLSVEYSDSGYGSFGVYNRDSSYSSVTLSYVEFTVSVQQSD